MTQYVLAFWNVENLFAPEGYPAREPWIAERLKNDLKGWTEDLFKTKLRQLGLIIRQIGGAGPDLLAVETIPDTDEAEVLVELLAEMDFPGWFSYSIEGSDTRAGQPLEDAFAIAAIDQVVAVGINCCRPDDVRHAVETAVAITGKPAIAYPNSGESWDATTHQWTTTPTAGRDLTTLSLGWRRAGAEYIGGCCRVGPADIRAMARAIGRS